MEKRLPGGVPAVRLSNRLQLAAFFPPSGQRGRRGSALPPALMVDVRVIIRRHFPIGRGRIVQKVAKDIMVRRQQARKLRLPECVERALAEDVLPLVEHPFDHGAVVAAREKICEYVAGACADPRLAKGGAQVLVLLDTFACPVFLRPPPRKPMMMISTGPTKHAGVAMRTNPCMKTEPGICAAVPAEKVRPPIGVIGDGRPKQVDERSKAGEVEERWMGWVPW
jgi:hypothetical protein